MTPISGQDSGEMGGERGASVQIRVSVQGKHPAFDDFLEGVGVGSAFIHQANRELVWDGIGSLIEADRWNGGKVVPGTSSGHWVYLWQRREEYLLGVLGPSRDGRGRAHVMTLLAEVSGADVFWGEEHLLPVLQEGFRQIRSRTTEEDFFAAVRDVERRLAERVQEMDPHPPRYAECTKAFLERAWLKTPPETLARVLHVICQNFSDVAANAVAKVPEGEPYFELMRFPCDDREVPVLAGWWALIRGQIHNQVPVFLARPEREPWVDVVLGRLPCYPDPAWRSEWGDQPALCTLACLQLDTSIVNPESLEPYVLESGFSETVRGVLEDLGKPWTGTAKRTVFGALPPSARPRLPGENPRREGAFFAEAARSTAALSRLSAGSKGWLARNASRVGMGVVGCAALALAGFLLRDSIIRGPSTDSQKPREGNPGVTASAGELRTEWETYLGDYRAWLGPLGEAVQGGGAMPAFLRTNLQAVLDPSRQEGTWEPLDVLGSRDPADISQPSDRLLAARAKTIVRAAQLGTTARRLVVEDYRNNFEARLDALTGTPLSGLVAGTGRQWSAIHQELANWIERKTNGPTVPLPQGPEAALALMAKAEDEIAHLDQGWKAWRAVERRVSTVDTNMLAPLLIGEMQRAVRGEPAAVLVQLSTLRRDVDGFADWLIRQWPSINQAALRADWETNEGGRSLMSWSNFAMGYVVGRSEDDPRIGLRGRITEAQWDRMASDLVEAAQGGLMAGLDVREATNELSALHQRLKRVDLLPWEQRNEAGIRSETQALLADYEAWGRRVEPHWLKLFDLQQLAQHEMRRDFEDFRVNLLWSNLISQATSRVKSNAGGRLPPSEIARWRDQISRVGEVCSSLAAMRTFWPDAVGPGSQLRDAGSEGDELARLLEEDYLQRLAARLFGPDLEVRRSLTEYASSAAATEDANAARAFASELNLALARGKALAAGVIPRDVQNWRQGFQQLQAAAGFNRTRGHTAVKSLLADLAPWPETGGRPGGDVDPTQLGRRTLAMNLALEVDALRSPGRPADWTRCLRLFGAARSKGVGATAAEVAGVQGVDLHQWLDTCWRSIAPTLRSWVSVAESEAAATNVGLAKGELPKSLQYLGRLGTLVRGFDPLRASEFQDGVRQLLRTEPVPPAHQALLSQIVAVSTNLQTDWTAIGPARIGFRAEPIGDRRLRLSRGRLVEEFVRFDLPAGSSVFVGVTEVSAKSFLEVTSDLPGALTLRDPGWVSTFLRTLSALKAPLEGGIEVAQLVHSFSCLRASRDTSGMARLTIPESRFVEGPFSESEALRPYRAIATEEPLNFVDGTLARRYAAAVGCRLATPREWRIVSALLGRPGLENRRDKELEGLLGEVARAAKLKSGVGIQEVFLRRPETDGKGVAPSDGAALFAGVRDERYLQGSLVHWRGNVAEWLADGPTMYVAGGSMVSSVDTDGGGDEPRELNPEATQRGYADIGFRLVFDWVGKRPVDEIRRLLAELTPATP